MDDGALTRLALRAREGDRAAATQFVALTYQQVWRVLVALSDRASAEDLAQETYARAFRSLPGFRVESTVRAWLLTIARRVAADHLRAAGPRRAALAPSDPDDALAQVPAPGDLSESLALRALVDDLPAERRLAFVLTQLVGLSYAEAAEVCDCPIGTVRSRVARARDELAAALTDRGRGPDARPANA